MPVTIAALNAIQGPGAQVREIGPQYDLMLATRDGTTLPCRNKDGDTVNIAKLALMTSVSNQNQQHEETELQHKDQLIQLSGNLIDREFEQWPQVSQGDWSGGTLQRVLTGSTPLTSFQAASDPTRYWDGLGLIWPISDYVPQQPFLPPPVQDVASGTPGVVLNSNVASGNLGYFGTPGAGFGYIYTAGGAVTLVYIGGFTPASRLALAAPVDVAPGDAVLMTGAHQVLWYTRGSPSTLAYANQNPVGTLVSVHFDTAVVGQTVINVPPVGATIGNRQYLAWTVAANGGSGYSFQFTVRLYDLGLSVPFVNTAMTPLTLPPNFFVHSTAFLGSSLFIAGTDGTSSSIIEYAITSGTFTTVARIKGSTGLRICECAGSLFVVSVNQAATSQETVDLYLLQGGSLQSIGPLAQGSYFTGSSQPCAYNEYVFVAAQDLNFNIQIYGYDILKGRLFKAASIPGPSNWGANNDEVPVLAAVPMLNRAAGGFGTAGQGNTVAFTAQWGLVLTAPSGVKFAQEMYWGIQQPGLAGTTVRQGVQITSSLIDFTSAQPKLWRQLLAIFSALGSNPAVSVTLNAWLDKNPEDITGLNLPPDFTTSVAGSTANAEVTTLALTMNQMATKLVYQVTVTPNAAVNAALVSAPKLVNLVARVATGWTRTNMLDLADDVMTNGKAPGTTAWSAQQPPGQPQLDGTAAYNFIRQLWRLRGGECVAVFPNGDPPANWLMQDGHFDSPKPFGVSFRADQRSRLEYLCQLKMREDV